jgi:hypothetical protein
MKDYYNILEVSFTASVDELKKGYRQKAIKYHPDKNLGDKYFVEKFIEAKEAYDVLSDPIKRSEYDILYKVDFEKEEYQHHNSNKIKKEREQEEHFYYDPYKVFYSPKDRIVNETPQFYPRFNHWAEAVSNDEDFFKLPKNIGKIISGYTTLYKGVEPFTRKQKMNKFLLMISIGLAISFGIILLFHIQNLVGLVLTVMIPLVIILIILTVGTSFSHTCTFIGINGFAEFKCKGSKDNIESFFEINFKDITDLIKVIEVRKKDFSYDSTAFCFAWFNNTTIIKDINDLHNSKEGNPDRDQTNYWLNYFAERYWTIYLMDNMEKDLETKGYLEFSLIYPKGDDQWEKKPYIQLGIGYIKFLTEKGSTSYNFNEIKKVYTKGTNLFIEHNNYEKKFFFIESGNKNGIPLMNLSNRLFFFRTMELLLGYKFS